VSRKRKTKLSRNGIIAGLLLSVFTLFSLSCGKKDPEDASDSSTEEQSVDEITADNDVIPLSSPSTLAVGGLPSEEEVEGAYEISSDEASVAIGSVQTAANEMPLGLAVTTEISLIQEDGGGGCQSGLFCLAESFSMIFDMVTGAASCNFKLLLGTTVATEASFRKVEGLPIYYVDGFGSIGIGDQGSSQCPSLEEVDNWAKKNRLRQGSPTAAVAKNSFFPPSRLVVYRHRDGKLRWQIVFFPKDFIGKLARRVSHFKNFADKDLDFVAYYGNQEFGEEVGSGVGSANINWDELARMMQLFSNDSPDENGGIPQGKILIEYDMKAENKKYTTTFLEGFSFGDEDDSPFKVGQPTTVLRSGGENYIHFQTKGSFGRPNENDPNDDGGPMGVVQYCVDGSWKEEGGGPFAGDVKYVDVPKSSYLPNPSISHMQMIWLDQETNGEPENYSVSLTAQKGGAYIYGDVEFLAGAVPGISKTMIRTKAPICESMTKAMQDELENAVRTGGNQPGFTFVDGDGYRNMLFDGPLGPNGGQPEFVSKAEAIKLFPTFSVFQLIEIGSEASPYTE